MHPHPNPPYALEARGVSKKFGYKTVLRDVHLSLASGESLVLFGPNGAGKTTLIQVLCSLLQPSSGSVRLGGYEVRSEREAVHKIMGFISHHPLLYPSLTAYENLKFYGRMYATPHLQARIEEVLNIVGMDDHKHDAVQTFSRGMQQRVSLARAIIHDPMLLFLDEPFTGLDQQGCDVLTRLMQAWRDQGKTVIMASHQLETGIELCSKAAILKSGRIIYMRDAARIRENNFPEIYAQQVGENNPPLPGE